MCRKILEDTDGVRGEQRLETIITQSTMKKKMVM